MTERKALAVDFYSRDQNRSQSDYVKDKLPKSQAIFGRRPQDFRDAATWEVCVQFGRLRGSSAFVSVTCHETSRRVLIACRRIIFV
eukprot:scaffold394136_cov17-Prasinocladus_malaysianus.AAC.1